MNFFKTLFKKLLLVAVVIAAVGDYATATCHYKKISRNRRIKHCGTKDACPKCHPKESQKHTHDDHSDAPAHKRPCGEEQKVVTAAAATTSSQKALSYSINLMWINRVFNPNQRFIHPSENEESLHEKFLRHIFKWASVSQGSVVNVWYDSALTSPQAVKITQDLINAYAGQHPEMAPIILRDVRIIPRVIQHPDVFGEKIPVYFRVDLLRPIIALHILNNRETDCFVYGDLDMEPLSREQLFDEETLQNLQKYGTVMARARTSGYGFENGFQIISNNNAHLFQAMEWALVELNIQRAYNALKGKFCHGDFGTFSSPMRNLVQAVYESYAAMFKYFYFLDKYGYLIILDPYPEDFNKKKHDLGKVFGLYYVKTYSTLHFLPWSLIREKPFYTEYGMLAIPTKEVRLPPTELDYKDPLFDPSSPHYIPYFSKDQSSC